MSGVKRKVRFILMNSIRVILLLAIVFSFMENRVLILLTTSALLVFTFLPQILNLIFKKDFFALFDIVLISFIFLMFSYWEIQGVYSNFVAMAILMNFISAIAIGFLGLTISHSFFKHAKLESNFKMTALFSFCLSFTIGVLVLLVEMFMDSLFGFNIQNSRVFGISGAISIYFLGCLLVSYIGYFNIKKGKVLFVSTLIENFIEKNLKFFGIDKTELSSDKIRELVKKGENHKIEFKSSLRKNLYTNALDKKIEHAVLKTISAYLNSDGGILLVGISDTGEILGIKEDQFQSKEHVNRHLNNLLANHIGAEFLLFITYEILELDEKEILVITCNQSTKEVFLKYENEEQFYVRKGPHSIPLIGSSLLNYIETKFRKKA